MARLGDGETKELFRRLLELGMQDLIDAERIAAIGPGPNERTVARSNERNGSRSRLLSTPAGDVELWIPKVTRVGSFFPSRSGSGASATTGSAPCSTPAAPTGTYSPASHPAETRSAR